LLLHDGIQHNKNSDAHFGFATDNVAKMTGFTCTSASLDGFRFWGKMAE